MTDDAKILRAIETLHIRFMEEPTEQKVEHIKEFIYGFRTAEGRFIIGSDYDIDLPCSRSLYRYFVTAFNTKKNKFSPKSLTQLATVAEEIF